MKKILFVFLLLCALFIGMELGSPTKESTADEINRKIGEFEKEITNPNNNYPKEKNTSAINPNITNEVAKTGEKAISSIFEYAFSIIESFISK